MASYKIVGRCRHVSYEFVRSWVEATLCVFSYHNQPLQRDIVIRLTSRLPRGDDGQWYPNGHIKVRNTLNDQQTAAVIVHELIHECFGDFGDGTDEKCTSTLNAKLRGDIGNIQRVLLDNTYQRAAYIAHTKMAYRSEHGDFYDPDEQQPVNTADKYGPRNTTNAGRK